MRTIFLVFFVTFLCGFSMQEAAAKGFGGRGFSSYRSKNSYAFARQKSTAPASARPWQSSLRGAFGGLLLGGLISSMFMGHGIGSALLSWLVVGALLMFCINIIRRQKQPTNRS